ncbi:Hsp20/alpha crystallin family protein [Flavobacteriaceae bacterium]|nr:Hsp20/alpha crystallin family protein [Flavobacteriaceae bacterium]MDB4086172.1 Hsp20/alpha crystallin family protein [Flavobacteriaceae bacterium]MDB4239654.1 Hsp20/alpha crystallin family protein [Flavobacteriaceae bacterium]MDB9902482.1 Hsp20/alpha crystallin family protein [Flavobacteriaceae bacterium]
MNLIKKQSNFLPFVFDDFFRNTWDILPTKSTNNPATNVIENDKEFILEFSIPGRDNLDFEIEIDNRLLSVSLKENDTISNNNYMLQEFNFSSFSKSYELPISIDLTKIESFYKNGILSINLPKRKEFHSLAKKIISVKK